MSGIMLEKLCSRQIIKEIEYLNIIMSVGEDLLVEFINCTAQKLITSIMLSIFVGCGEVDIESIVNKVRPEISCSEYGIAVTACLYHTFDECSKRKIDMAVNNQNEGIIDDSLYSDFRRKYGKQIMDLHYTPFSKEDILMVIRKNIARD